MWWLYSLRKFEFEWNFEALLLNAVKTLKGKINDGVVFSLVIGIDAAELGGHLRSQPRRLRNGPLFNNCHCNGSARLKPTSLPYLRDDLFLSSNSTIYR
jgi:hypothetical protein